MGVRIMSITLDHAYAVRDHWSLTASALFDEGVHLVSGDTGSGKSTLALMMAGLFPLTGGSIGKQEISSCMLSLQFPELQVTGRTLEEECISWGAPAGDILEAAGLTGRKDASPLSLSRGELKRLHLACLFSRDYDLLLLDEPFSSLDCGEKSKICTAIEQKPGITVIFTHEQEILPRVSMIWEIADGRLIGCGKPPEAFERWHHIPAAVKRLADLGLPPANIAIRDIREAACRIHG
jgi:energy-coupling factor transport system ATP-binding protein